MKIAEILEKALAILWDGENPKRGEGFICVAIKSVMYWDADMSPKGLGEAHKAIAFLVNTYGMGSHGNWFDRKSDHSDNNYRLKRQQRRIAFLKCAIKHAHKIGV